MGSVVGGLERTRLIRGFQARLRLQGGSRLAGPGLQGAPGIWRSQNVVLGPPRRPAGLGAARREHRAQPSG